MNARLRELWEYVILDPATFEPVGAKWTIGSSPAEVRAAEERAQAQMDDYEPPVGSEERRKAEAARCHLESRRRRGDA